MIGKKFEKAMLTSVGVANFLPDATNHLADKRALLDAFIHKTLEKQYGCFLRMDCIRTECIHDNQDALYVNTRTVQRLGVHIAVTIVLIM